MGAEPALRRPLLHRDRLARLLGPRLGLPRRDRRRGALRRHGPLRRPPDPPRVVRRRAARPRAELLRAGRDHHLGPRRRREPVLPDGAGARVDGLPGRGPRHDRDRHREPGRHLGRVLAHAAGGSARLPAAPRHPADVVARDRADLYPGRQLGAARGVHRPRARLPDVDQPRRGLRRGRHDDDGRHDAAVLRRGPPHVGLEPLGDARALRRLPRRGPRLPRRQPYQDPRRWLVPARGGPPRVHAHGDVEARTRGPLGAPRGRVAPAEHVPRRPRRGARSRACRARPSSWAATRTSFRRACCTR